MHSSGLHGLLHPRGARKPTQVMCIHIKTKKVREPHETASGMTLRTPGNTVNGEHAKTAQRTEKTGCRFLAFTVATEGRVPCLAVRAVLSHD